MGNILNEAADLLASGRWCTGSIKDGDKFCAVGALAYVGGVYEQSVAKAGVAAEGQFTTDSYSFVRQLPEAKILAQEILKTDFAAKVKANAEAEVDGWDYVGDYFDSGYYDDVIVEFNDNQENSAPVIEIFRKAAQRLDSEVES